MSRESSLFSYHEREVMVRLLVLSWVVVGCAHTKPVTKAHWDGCQWACAPKMVKEACVHGDQGEGCTCDDEETIWLEDRD